MNAVADMQPFDLLLDLEAQLRAARLEQSAGEAQAWSGLAFRLRDRWLLTPRQDVREVIPAPKLTRVPGAKRWLLGVANVRGGLLPVTDLGLWLDLPVATPSRNQRVLVFNSERIPAGFLVDEVAGHRQFAPADQRPELSRDAGTLTPYLLGGFSREGRGWLALSLHKLTQAPAFADAGI
ncbi:MAG: chemotaxis protein CheW [Nevskia sp.]|nr:chemotaxis protein CheW [Nevskia sp.]